MLIPVLLLFIAMAGLQGAIVAEGAVISEVSKAMSEAGYEERGLDMEPTDPRNRLVFWSVDDGILIIAYSAKSKKVIDISYWLSDERPKATRWTHEIHVKSFDTISGVMLVQTKTPKRNSRIE